MTLGRVGAGVVIVVGVDAVAEADAKITHVLYDGESISAVYRQKELFRRRDHNLLGSRYGVFSPGQWQGGHVESGASLGGSDSAGHVQDWSGAIYVVRGNVILMGWSRMCLWMFMDKQAVGVQLGEVVVQGCVDGQELVQEHQDTWCN